MAEGEWLKYEFMNLILLTSGNKETRIYVISKKVINWCGKEK